jgi:hypothetical protein
MDGWIISNDSNALINQQEAKQISEADSYKQQ